MSQDFDAAVTEADKALEIDPQLYQACYYKGRALFSKGDFPKAAEAFRAALKIRPDDNVSASILSTTIASFGSREERQAAAQNAVEVSKRYLSLNPDDALALSRTANDLIFLGQVEKGLEMAERAYRINPKFCGYNVACAFMQAGRAEKALEYLEEQMHRRSLDAAWIENDSDWDPVRDHPRFQAIRDHLSS